MRRFIVGITLATSAWVCAGIYLILAAQAFGKAAAHGNASLLGEGAYLLFLGVMSWAVLLFLGSLFGIKLPRLTRKKNR
ncbi:hypothetical protein [Paenarthrobacter nitroguajacolicus]